MKLRRTLLFTLIFLFFNTHARGQQKYPSTLLWKISGKNLEQPSYLYGTMHLQDRRLFYFGDSLYAALEKTEGFAMEINPLEMMDSIFRSFSKKDTSDLLKKILDEAEYKKIAKKLEKKFNMPADKITTKRLAAEKRRMNAASTKKDDMPTIMDLYLFSIARKQGKLTGGIEDLGDQFEITDEIGKFDINDFIKDDTMLRRSYLETMLNIYVNRDLTTLNTMVNGSRNNSFNADFLLIKRNKKMAMRMDSLSHMRPTFFAVGAAHLPGDSGLINILTKMGYAVEPVFSSKNLAPEDYKYTTKEIPWINVEDENKMCSITMPGAPTDILVMDALPMKIYMDLFDMNVYGLAVTPVSEEEAKSDSVINRLVEIYKNNDEFNVKSVKNITYKGSKGVEMHAIQKGDYDLRYRMLIKGNKLFMIIFGGKNKEQLYSTNAEKFIGSLSFNDENIESKNTWQLFSNAKNAFSMMAPGKTIETSQRDEEGEAYDQFTSVDYNDGTYYMVIIRDTKPGYFIEDDSTYFAEYKKNMEAIPTYQVKDFEQVKFKDHNACHFSALQNISNTEVLLEGYLIRRGNRTYVLMVAMPKAQAGFPQVTNFFRSFNLLPYKTAGWKKQPLGKTNISMNAPGPLMKVETDSLSYDFERGIQKYRVQDINTAASYSVDVETISPYYWSNSDSTFFKDRADSFKGYNDSLISWKYLDNGIKQSEVLVKRNGSELYKKLKVYLNGDTLYTLYCYQNIANDSLTDKFFSGIEFPVQYPSTIFTNKAALLMEILQGKDSTVVADAKAVLKSVKFTKNDLPLLYKAFPKKYTNYEDSYVSINELLADEIVLLDDSNIVSYVTEQYKISNSEVKENKMLMLVMLARQKTASSYKLLKQFLLSDPPAGGKVHALVNALMDTADLVKDIFPAATALYADTATGPGIVKLANYFTDSSIVTATDILQNEKGLIELAEKQYKELKNDKDAYPLYNAELITLLSRFNSEKSDAILNKFLLLPDMWTKNNALLALIKNNKPVPESEIKKFASDKDWRTAFYESLKEIKKVSLFPKEFYTQQKFAESYLQVSLTEGYEVDVKSMQFVKEKTAEINGKMKRFYIYKVVLNDDEDKTARFAVSGEFDLDKNKVELDYENQDTYLDYDEQFSSSKVDELFKKYLEQKKSNAKPE